MSAGSEGRDDFSPDERSPHLLHGARAASLGLCSPGGNRAHPRPVGICMTTGHKITIVPADTPVEVKLAGETIAKSDRAIRLDDTALPARYYIPRDAGRA